MRQLATRRPTDPARLTGTALLVALLWFCIREAEQASLPQLQLLASCTIFLCSTLLLCTTLTFGVGATIDHELTLVTVLCAGLKQAGRADSFHTCQRCNRQQQE